jgi:hypothetical protein
VNGDGRDDVLWRQADGGRVAVWLMDGSQVTGVREYQARNATDWLLVTLGDVDNDGLADLVWQNQVTGAIRLWYLDRAGLVTAQRQISPGEDAALWKVKAAGNFCGNGCEELFCKYQDSEQSRILTGEGQIYELSAP